VGRLWGDGSVGVVLAHGFSEGVAQEAWLSFAEFLADRRYRVLTFNFRGFCDSEGCSEGSTEVGKNWLDAIAAVRFMEASGAEKIFLVGASMGGLAVLRAARTPGVDVAGVVSLATPQFPSRYYPAFGEPQANDLTPARLRQIDEPKLFVAGVDDVQTQYESSLGPGVERVRFAADAKRMFGAADEPKDLVLVDSSAHSSELVTQAEDEIVDETRTVILGFIEELSR
jgi:pimeloyl-ACP methyl ester carboxylesterase